MSNSAHMVVHNKTMLAYITSSGVSGVEGCPVGVEVDTAPGLPTFDIIGLPDASVREAKDRVRSALRNAGLELPMKRVTVNLTPADMRKVGTGLDLPIALGVLASVGVIPDSRAGRYSAIGELSLDGQVHRITGAVPMTSHLLASSLSVMVPLANVEELSLLPSPALYPISSLSEAVDLIRSGFRRVRQAMPVPTPPATTEQCLSAEVNLRDIVGLQMAKRALEVAASGGHHLLISGPPGIGKSLLARALYGLLPPLSPAEAVEVFSIHSAGGLACDSQLLRPQRAPHHSVSATALVGGGVSARPGEVSLAHRGVLILDELPEFRRDCIESLRQPLELGFFNMSRARWTYRFPCDFQMVATANLCPCGNYGRPSGECHCSERARASYVGKLSGPLLDRVDMYITLTARPDGPVELGEDSSVVGARVARVRKMQVELRRGLNVRAEYKALLERDVSSDAVFALEVAVDKTGMSMRSQAKTLRVARTIADMAGSKLVCAQHVQEAFRYRVSLLSI